MLVLTLYYPLLLFLFGDPDPGPLAALSGLLLVGAASFAVGYLGVVAVPATRSWRGYGFGITDPALVCQWRRRIPFRHSKAVLDYLALPATSAISPVGIIDTKNLIYYLSLTRPCSCFWP